MASIMNNNYNIKETHNVNKTMNNKYRITIKDTPVQHVETPHMRRSTRLSEIKSGLKESTLRIKGTG